MIFESLYWYLYMWVSSLLFLTVDLLWQRQFCLGAVGEAASRPLRLFICGLHFSSWPVPQVPWLNRATYFALGMISSAWPPLSLSIAGQQFPGIPGSTVVTPGLFSHQRNCRLRRDFSVWCHTGLGVVQCSQHVAIHVSLLMQSALVFVVRGVPPPVF